MFTLVLSVVVVRTLGLPLQKMMMFNVWAACSKICLTC